MLAPDRLRSDHPAVVIRPGPRHTDVTRPRRLLTVPAVRDLSYPEPPGHPKYPELAGTSRN